MTPDRRTWNERRYYLRALWLPILLPLPCVIIWIICDSIGESAWQALGSTASFIVMFFAMSLLIAGIPYFIVMILGYFLTRNRSIREIKLWGASMPVQLAMLMWFSDYIFQINKGDTPLFSLIALVVGYLYVIPVLVYGAVRKRCSTNKEKPHDPTTHPLR